MILFRILCNLSLQLVTESDSGFIRGLKSWVVPFLKRLEGISAGRSRGLLKQYLTQVSKVCLSPNVSTFCHGLSINHFTLASYSSGQHASGSAILNYNRPLVGV